MKSIPIPYDGTEKYVFVSYSHKDKDIVYQDIHELINQGVRVWYDQGIPAGPNWDKYVQSKIKSEQCSVVLFFVSENSVRSKSIAEEIKIVFNTDGKQERVKENFSIHLGGKSAYEMLFQSSDMEIPDVENTSLVIKYFNKERKFIPRLQDESQHIKDTIVSLGRYEVIDEKYKYKAIQRNQKFDILMIGKNSTFTKSIKAGINEKFSSEVDYNFNSVLIDVKEVTNPEDKMIDIIEENEYMTDGFFLRPIHDISQKMINKMENLISMGKKIILLDKDLNETQKSSFKFNLPVFLASNFTMGGQQIARMIEKLIVSKGHSNYKIIILDGPKNIVSAEQRSRSLKKSLQDFNLEMNATIFMIDSFDVDSAKNLLEHKLRYLYKNEKDSLCDLDIYIYLGNDNIAKEIIKTYKEDSDSYIKKYLSKAKSIVFIGYDGIKDLNNNIDLFNYGVNTITVDVLPSIQGMKAAEVMINLLTKINPITRIDIMPEVRNNICIKPLKGKSILSINKYMKDKKIIVFDLDGTIANTEMLHFKSYQRILSEYGIDFQMKDFESYIGNPEAIIWENMIIDYNLDITVNESILKRTKILLELVVEEDLKPYDYFLQILRTYKTTEKVILSSQIPEVIDFLIDRWGIKDIFTEKRIFSVSDRLHSKFEVLKSLGEFYPSIGSDYSPSEVIIFEDSNHTLKIAKQLGIDSIGIEHQFNHNQLTNCNFILNEEISSGIFIGLAGMDIVHYQDNKLQDENSKSKTDDYAVYVGGPAANAAIVFSQLGGDAILISCIGDSEIGKAIKAMLRRYGVTVIDAMKEENTIPNISSVIVNKSNGNRTIISGQKIYNDRDYKADINIIESADFLMYDCNTPLLFNSNKHIGTNRKIILDAGSYKEHLRDILNDADEVISSAHFKINNQTIIEKQDDYKIKFAAISNGPNPIICRVENSEITYIKPPKVYPVVDTLGAGDALHGAYCFYRFQKKMTYENALTKASEYASKTVQHRGVIKVDDL